MREPGPTVVILGAARSGTKLLRDLLASHPAACAVPYDVNFVWKYGNFDVPHDELEPGHARPPVKRYIRRAIERHRERSSSVLFEKTVGNTLRPAFVRAVYPEARFIHLVRDGRDVVESAARLWRAPMDVRAVLRKLPAFPLLGLPSYALQYVASYARRSLRQDRRSSTWGPRFRGIDEAARDLPLLQVCAIQWRRSIEVTLEQLADLNDEALATVHYERLVTDPEKEVGRLLDFCALGRAPEVSRAVAERVHSGRVGRAREALSDSEMELVVDEIGPTLRRLEYGV